MLSRVVCGGYSREAVMMSSHVGLYTHLSLYELIHSELALAFGLFET